MEWSPSRPALDSSDEDEVDPTGYPVSAHENTALSTFHPVLNQNVYSISQNECAVKGKAVILVLQPDETIALVGAYTVCVLQGSLSLLGVSLSPSNTKHTVFAPRSSPLPVLSWASSDCQGSCTFPIPPAVRQQENTTIILVESVHTGVEGLGRICRVFENAFNPPRESCILPGMDPSKIYVINNVTENVHPFMLPSSWVAALVAVDEHPVSDSSSPPVCLVKGPRKSGKSSLARTLVNRLLCRYRRVAFLECDLGQSEFTPGGLVALNLVENYAFGPPFTHPSLPYRAHYVGSTSPRASPSHYLHSIQCLVESYKLDLQFLALANEPFPGDERIHDAIPLVVNTMGWTKGLGADLNKRIEEFVQASYTFQVGFPDENVWSEPLESHHMSQSTLFSSMQAGMGRSIKVDTMQTETANVYYTATDHRHLNILSFFYAVFSEQPTSSPGSVPKQITATSWDTSLPMCARYPYEVDCMQAFDRVFLTGPGYEDVVASELARVLNGAIVGLVSDGSANSLTQPAQPSSQESSSLSYTPGEPLPDPALSTCHGLALIRGIPLGSHSPHMHILTPLPTRLLAQTRLLVKGEMELPIWGMLDFRESEEGRVAGVEKGQVPYLQWGKAEGIGSEKRRVRRNLMRRGQM